MLKTKTKKKNSKIKSNKKSNRGVVTSISKKKKKVAKKLKTSNKKVIKKNKLRIVTISETPIIESSKKTKRTRKPKNKMYFTSETEEAINQYNQSQEQSERDEIYNSKIKYAFEKLVENVFNTFKFCYFETGPIEVQKETIAHLVANIHKFESGKGKAFSYFSIIANFI